LNCQTFILSTLDYAEDHIPNSGDESITSEIFKVNIPIQYRLTINELTEIQSQCKSSGNFALKLVVTLFPENLRYNFSFNGGDPKGKRGYNDTRKCVIKRYTLCFY